MELGAIVTVKATGRRARILAELSQGRYEVEFMPELTDDPTDRSTVQSEEEGGIYRADELEVSV